MKLRTILLATTLSFVVSPALAQIAQPPLPQPKPIKRGVASFWTSPEPTFDEGTYDRINAAMLSYAAIEVRGGWPTLAKVNLAPGASGPDVAKLRQRLAITDDLPAEVADGDAYDMMLTEAVKRFQARHGLPETGTVGPQTHRGAQRSGGKTRIRQLAASLDRLHGMGFTFGQRYVVVNIPAAVAEAIEDGKVARRYVTVVGKVDRPSPTLTTQITAVNLNPTWTVPLSILKKDIVTKMRKDPDYVGAHEDARAGCGRQRDRCALGRLAVGPHAELHGAAGLRRRQRARQGAHRHAEPAFGLHARHQPQGILLARTIASSPRAARASKACSISRPGS